MSSIMFIPVKQEALWVVSSVHTKNYLHIAVNTSIPTPLQPTMFEILT
jgi:hypothetical protein